MRKRRTPAKRPAPIRRRTATRRAIGVTNPTDLLLVVGGAIAGNFVAKKFLSNMNDTVKNGALVGSYFLLPMIAKQGKQKQMLQMLGAGMAVSGAMGLMSGFGIGAVQDDMLAVNISDLETIGVNVLGAGDVLAGSMSTISGMDDISVINGCDQDDFSDFEDLD